MAFTPGTFKIYLSADIETSALRIMCANRAGEHAATLDETIAQTRARRASEKKRYMEQYGVDIKDMSNYSLIVDTTVATPDQIADIIVSAFEIWQNNKDYKQVFISPERLNYPDTPTDAERISELSCSLDCGENIGVVEVFERDGEFYLSSGLEEALAYSFNMNTFIPAVLVSGEPSGEYVKMKNSL